MKKQKANPAKCKVCVLRQLCNFIPGHLVAKLARQYGVDKKARSFSPWSHIVSLLYAQITHAIGLNDVCDGLVHHRGLLASIRGASAPSRNGLSYANKHRDARMAGELFWSVLKHLQSLSPGFAGGKFKGFPRRFKRVINIVDSSTIGLVANCMDWAKHRRRKAAAKCHMRLDLQSFLPRFAIIDTARDNDAKRAREMCAALCAPPSKPVKSYCLTRPTSIWPTSLTCPRGAFTLSPGPKRTWPYAVSRGCSRSPRAIFCAMIWWSLRTKNPVRITLSRCAG